MRSGSEWNWCKQVNFKPSILNLMAKSLPNFYSRNQSILCLLVFRSKIVTAIVVVIVDMVERLAYSDVFSSETWRQRGRKERKWRTNEAREIRREEDRGRGEKVEKSKKNREKWRATNSGNSATGHFTSILIHFNDSRFGSFSHGSLVLLANLNVLFTLMRGTIIWCRIQCKFHLNRSFFSLEAI